MHQKYVNSIPLYRQEKIWEEHGLALSRATMANWVIRCAEDYFKPVTEHLRKELMSREVVYCDETPVQVLKGTARSHRPSLTCGSTGPETTVNHRSSFMITSRPETVTMP